MAKKKSKLRGSPQYLRKDNTAWYYEDNGHLNVHIWTDQDGRRFHSSVNIPWRQVRASLRRKDAS